MTWQIFLLMLIVGLFAACLLISISSMLAIRIVDAIVATVRSIWRRCRRILA